MAWEDVAWACGHEGQMQLYGKRSAREATIARQSGMKCFACWLVNEWETKNDPRALREDRYVLAASIAENKGSRIEGLPESCPPVDTSRQALEIEREQLIKRLAIIDSLLNTTTT